MSMSEEKQIAEEQVQNPNEEVEEVEEPLDPEVQEAMKNVHLDEGIFSKSEKTVEKNSKSTNKKVKKNKGEDFLDYANKNGIELNFQYEDKVQQDKKTALGRKVNYKQTDYPQPVQSSQPSQPSTGLPKTEKSLASPYEKKPYTKFQSKKPFYKKPFRTGNNKFDQCNMHLSKLMPMMTPLYNPYTLQGNGYSNYPSPSYCSTPQVALFDLPEVALSVPAVTCFLEAYLSLENLNSDLYLRNRIDENGFIEVSEVANHNKLRTRGVTTEFLLNIFGQNDNSVVECASFENCVMLRNRDWENIKEQLLPREVIQQNKRMLKSQMNAQYANSVNPMNMNYVSMQNNYFFNGMPTGDSNLGLSAMYMGYQYPGNMGMNQMGYNPVGQMPTVPNMPMNTVNSTEQGEN